jgi:hypothetical protein
MTIRSAPELAMCRFIVLATRGALQVCRAQRNVPDCRQSQNHRVIVSFTALSHFAVDYFVDRFRAAVLAPNWDVDMNDLQGRLKPARKAQCHWERMFGSSRAV